jgi:flavodoxin
MGKSIIFMYSYHGMNTQKIGKAIAEKINASIIDVNNNPDLVGLDACDLIGFGAGISGGKHYSKMLKYAERLPNVQNKKAFIFSTSGSHSGERMASNHKALRDILKNKGFVVIDEFGCKGFVYFLFKFICMNKNRPNEDDIKNAEIFAEKLLKNK